MIDKNQVFFGSLLGDGTILKRKTGNPLYWECHSMKQEEYLLWKKNNLPFYTNINSYPTTHKKVILYSRRNKDFLKYAGYRKNPDMIKKIVTKLNSLGLLIWIFDDGNYNYSNDYISISSQGLGLNLNRFVANLIKKKFKLNPKLRYVKLEDDYILVFSANDTRELVSLFEKYLDYLPKSMLYKLGKDRVKSGLQKNKRKKQAKRYNHKNKAKINDYKRKRYWKNVEKFRRYAREWARERYPENKDKVNEQRRINYQKNREKILKKRKADYKKNREKISMQFKKYYQKNKKKIINQNKVYYQENKEKIKAQKIKYYKHKKLEM